MDKKTPRHVSLSAQWKCVMLSDWAHDSIYIVIDNEMEKVTWLMSGKYWSWEDARGEWEWQGAGRVFWWKTSSQLLWECWDDESQREKKVTAANEERRCKWQNINSDFDLSGSSWPQARDASDTTELDREFNSNKDVGTAESWHVFFYNVEVNTLCTMQCIILKRKRKTTKSAKFSDRFQIAGSWMDPRSSPDHLEQEPIELRGRTLQNLRIP